MRESTSERAEQLIDIGREKLRTRYPEWDDCQASMMKPVRDILVATYGLTPAERLTLAMSLFEAALEDLADEVDSGNARPA